MAFTGTFSTQSQGPTLLTLCNGFFNNRRLTNAEMVERYRKNVNAEQHSNGFIILHELQHMPKATSPDPKAEDELDPNGRDG
ncbi:hypothetical protein LX32DRAFT_645211, partial [Colletotrichum zoysiae]